MPNEDSQLSSTPPKTVQRTSKKAWMRFDFSLMYST
jgi:hypothetical protein